MAIKEQKDEGGATGKEAPESPSLLAGVTPAVHPDALSLSTATR